MITLHTLAELRAKVREHRLRGERIGLVPTMGNLHNGHIQLVHEARQHADFVVTTVFVNPLQFGAHEDLDAYPRTLAEDQARLAAAGNHLLFAPSVNEVYPHGLEQQTRVQVPDLTELHCGASRPGHFAGVATVVTMLFNMVQPDVAVFGEKDYQQIAVIRKMVRDLHMPVDIIGVPTVRADDGLALSSRNGYLSAGERARAPRLYAILQDTARALQVAHADIEGIRQQALTQLQAAGFRPDYYNIVNSHNLRPATADDRELTILAAAFLGTTRLIDNLSIQR